MSREEAPPRTTRWRLGRLAKAAVPAGILALAALLPAARPLPFDLCLWHRLTGWRCLGCGLTRSICHLMQGDPAGSLALHPAGPLVALAIALLAARRVAEALRGEPFRPTGGLGR